MNELEQLRAENEALKERNAELVATSEVMEDCLIDSTAQMEAIIKLSRDKIAISLTEVESVISANMTALKLTPTQCLADIKARAIEHFAQHLKDIKRLESDSPSIFRMREYAARLRKDAARLRKDAAQ